MRPIPASPRRSWRLGLVRLEDRVTPAGNLHVTNARLVDGNLAFQTAPVTGHLVTIRADWTTSGLAGGESYIVRFSMDGVPVNSATQTGQAGSLSFNLRQGGWYASPGSHSIIVVIDADNTIAETDEADNSMTFSFTTAAPTDLPSKFLRPVGGAGLNRDWAINNYADVDPRSGVAVDYRGGPFQYDGHNAVDGGPYGFDRMDAGLPVFAAAAGTVTEVQDGNFDRETVAANRPANYVRIDHGNNWSSIYFHLARNTITVKVGDVVKAGQVIALLGSSGDSDGPHLHFTPLYRNAVVEMGYDTAAYESDPMPYGGDVPAFIFDAGLTNYDPSPDISEHVSSITSFSTTQAGTLYFWTTTYGLDPADRLVLKYYRPDGSLFTSNTIAPTQSYRFSYWFFSRSLSQFQSSPGTWQEAWEMNGVEQKRVPFTITASGAISSVRLTDAGGRIVIDGRTTPFDFGSVASGAAAPQLSFTFNNHGAAALNLTNAVLPPGFSLVGGLPTNIAAGSSAALTVRMDTAVVGPKLGALRFDTNDPDAPTFRFNVSGNITGTAPPGAPVIGLPDPALGYDFASLPRVLSPGATLTDSNSLTFASGQLKIEFAAGNTANDRLGIRHQGTGAGQIGVAADAVTFGGVPIGTLTGGGTGSAPLIVTFNAAATPAAVQAVMRNVTYANVGVAPETAPRYVRFTVTDETALTSNAAFKTVSPSGVRRAPTIAALPPQSLSAGTTMTLTGSFTDPFGSSWTATADYGDGTGVQPVTLNADKTLTLSHLYVAPGNYATIVRVVSDIGGVGTQTMAVVVTAQARVWSVRVNDGSPQRSMVTSLTVTFSGVVVFTGSPSAAFQLARTGPDAPTGNVTLAVDLTGSTATQTIARLTFSGPLTGGPAAVPSLIDGNYTLTVFSGQVVGGLQGGDHTMNLYRLYGDVNGDKAVNGLDLAEFRIAFGTSFGNPGYADYLDANGDGAINGLDLPEFRVRFGTSLP